MIKKHSFLMLSLALFASSASAQSVINWNVATNILKDATVTTSSTRTTGDNTYVTDGDVTTGWQAVEKANNVTGNDDWVIIDLGSSKTIADVEVVQQDALATKYDFYLVNDAPAYESRDITVNEVPVNVNYLTETWYAANTPIYTHDANESSYHADLHGTNYDNHAVNATGRYIVIVAKEYNIWATGYGLKLWEVRATEKTADIDNAKAISLADVSVKNGQSTTVTLSAITVGGKTITDISALSNISLAVNDATSAVITDKGNGTFEIAGKKVGTYTLTASATVNGENVTATAALNVLFSWDGATDVALNKTATASHNSDNAYKAINGTGQGWEVGANVTTGTWYQVDLGGEYNISAIGIQWEAAYANHYKYYYATEVGTDNEPVWTELLEVNSTKNVDNNTIFTDEFNTVTARYVKLECIESQIWGMHFWNFKVAGAPTAAPVATTMEIATSANGLFLDETATITSVVKDQFGSVMDITPALSITDGASVGTLEGSVFTPTAKGTATIQATAGDIQQSIEIIVAADKDGYLVTPAAKAIAKNAAGTEKDGIAAIDNDMGLWVEFPKDEMPSSITVELEKSYILDMITIDWERACASDFTVKLAYAESELDTAEPIYVVAGRKDPGANIQDRIYGKEMVPVKYIKIEMTGAATDWTTKILEIRPYGVIDPVTAVESVSTDNVDANAPVDVYTFNGVLVRKSVLPANATEGLAPGMYLVGKEKKIVR